MQSQFLQIRTILNVTNSSTQNALNIRTQELNRCMHLYFKVSSLLGDFTKAEKYDLFIFFIN